MDKENKFQRFADWVSVAMGKPANITFWFVLIVAWTCIFAFGGSHLANGSFMPAWFTSLGFNLPLNLLTTLAELFIGFLVATAATRSQTALTGLLVSIKSNLDKLDDIDEKMERLILENTELTKAIHAATVNKGKLRVK